MKSILTLALSLILFCGQAQNVSDYKYISISSNFSGFDAGQYQLNNYLRLLLSQKEYEVLSDNRNYWPEDAKLNPCMVLKADVDKVSSTFNNKLILQFEDCNQTVLYKFDGESNIKEFEKGYKDALRMASTKVPTQNAEIPTYRQDETKEFTKVTTTTVENPGTALFKKYSNKPVQNKMSISIDKISGEYILNGETYFKSNLENRSFIIITPDKQRILAHFYPSSKPGIYHVYLAENQDTEAGFSIGYFDGENLSYEYLTENQSPRLVEFIKK